jgi:hypothetical protein
VHHQDRIVAGWRKFAVGSYDSSQRASAPACSRAKFSGGEDAVLDGWKRGHVLLADARCGRRKSDITARRNASRPLPACPPMCASSNKKAKRIKKAKPDEPEA